MRAFFVLVALLSFSAACDRRLVGEGGSATAAADAQAAHPAVVLGQPVTSADRVSLSAIAKDPRQFEGRTFSTTGKVTAVCQEAGCWMDLTDDQAHAHVRMHGHSFFVPKSAAGRLARVQATLVPKRGAGHDDCEASQATQFDLDATGVELDSI
jgi:hypothetical protein